MHIHYRSHTHKHTHSDICRLHMHCKDLHATVHTLTVAHFTHTRIFCGNNFVFLLFFPSIRILCVRIQWLSTLAKHKIKPIRFTINLVTINKRECFPAITSLKIQVNNVYSEGKKEKHVKYKMNSKENN